MARRVTAARRYAEAAFQIGRAAGSLDRWQRDLERLQAALDQPDLAELVVHPAVPYASKERVLRRVVGDVSDEALNLVLLMIRRGHARVIGRMVEQLGALVRRDQGIQLAEIRSALPLDDAQRAAIVARLVEVTGERVEINEVVDEALIGGVTVRIGDVLYDASVRTRLERLRARLTAI
jgi:F-type H+-transporting ATPase subunit delta